MCSWAQADHNHPTLCSLAQVPTKVARGINQVPTKLAYGVKALADGDDNKELKVRRRRSLARSVVGWRAVLCQVLVLLFCVAAGHVLGWWTSHGGCTA